MAERQYDNEILKLAFQQSHDNVAAHVDVDARILGPLFQNAIIDAEMWTDLLRNPSRTGRCHQLLVRLHDMNLPNAFVHLLNGLMNSKYNYSEIVAEINRKYAEIQNLPHAGARYQPLAAGRQSRPWVVRTMSAVVHSYPGRQSIAVGAILVVAALLSFIFNIVDLVVTCSSFSRFHGFWGSITCLLAGCIGILAGRLKIQCQIAAFCASCVVAVPIALAQFIVGLSCAIYPDVVNGCDSISVYIAMEALLAGLAVVEAIAASCGSVICGKAYCVVDTDAQGEELLRQRNEPTV